MDIKILRTVPYAVLLTNKTLNLYNVVAEYRNHITRGPMMKKETRRRIYEMHAEVCSVLSNAKRLEIIDLLRSGEKTAGGLTKEMGISKANVSQQLAVLRNKGILCSRREDQHIFYRLAFPGMLKAYDLLRQVLIQRLREQGKAAARLGRKADA
jgi:ArsR family transcriptional regulator